MMAQGAHKRWSRWTKVTGLTSAKHCPFPGIDLNFNFPRKMKEEKRLIELFRELSVEQRETVLAFLEFLTGRNPKSVKVEDELPKPIPRPAEESVVKALKRLRETYFMLDPGKLLHESSGHMQQHVMQGKPAAAVIDDLEILFARHYEQHKNNI
jgi:hypothetical protein